MPQMLGEPKSTGIQTLRNRTPRGRDASKERSLSKVREAHHSALAVAVTFEGEIEWLSHPLIWSQSETQTHSYSRDCHRHRSREQKRRCHQVWLYNPPLRSSKPRGDKAATEDVDLGDPPEFEPGLTYFLQASAESSGEENVKVPSPKPPIGELQRWVSWKA